MISPGYGILDHHGPEYHTQVESWPTLCMGGWLVQPPPTDGPEYLPRGDHDPPCVGWTSPPPTQGGHDLPWVGTDGPEYHTQGDHDPPCVVGGGWTSSPPYTRWVMISPGYGILDHQ